MNNARHSPLLFLLIAFMTIVAATDLKGQQVASSPPVSTTGEAEAEGRSMMNLLKGTMTGPTLQTRHDRYTLRPGDVVEIGFTLAPSFNQVQSVQPDGYIALQNLGELHVAGKTVPELTEALKEKYSKVMRDPMLTVVLKDFEHPYFIASGQVARPGKYELRGVTTATQALAIAGGFNDVAKSTHVLLFRRVSDQYVSVKDLNLKKMFSEKNLEEDITLEPGDLLFVPKSVTASILKSLLPHSSAGLYVPVRTY